MEHKEVFENSKQHYSSHVGYLFTRKIAMITPSFHLLSIATKFGQWLDIIIINEFLVSKETVVLRRWERSKQKFGFIKRVDKG